MTSDELQRALDRQAKELAGLSPVEKQIILLKLTDLYENIPENFGQYQIAPRSPEREWLSAVGALIRTYNDNHFAVNFNVKMQFLNSLGNAHDIVGIVGDLIEAIKLELELDGRSEIGTVYRAGEVYQFYADLRSIIRGAEQGLYLIEPYLTGEAFNEYFGGAIEVPLQLLVGRTAADLKPHIDRHIQQFDSQIDLRHSRQIHDRLFIVDRENAWVLGGSLNQTGDKPTYLLPLPPGVSATTRDMYSEIWEASNPVE